MMQSDLLCFRPFVAWHLPGPAQNELTLEGIRQFYVAIEKEEWGLDTLYDLYETLTITHAIIYCNTRRKVDFLQDQLTNAISLSRQCMQKSTGRSVIL